MHRIFVYGSLKEGCCNFHVNRGRRVTGSFVTQDRYALYILGDENLPWLVPVEDSSGFAVVGQLFEVDNPTLAAMDALQKLTDTTVLVATALDVTINLE